MSDPSQSQSSAETFAGAAGYFQLAPSLLLSVPTISVWPQKPQLPVSEIISAFPRTSVALQENTKAPGKGVPFDSGVDNFSAHQIALSIFAIRPNHLFITTSLRSRTHHVPINPRAN